MAQYTVSFSCGHADTVNLVGPETERRRKIAWYERSGDCPACREAAKAAARAAADAADAATLAGEDLPALTGSEAQVRWATDLRRRHGAAMVAIRRVVEGNPRASETVEGRAVVALVDLALRQAAAKWWIDHTRDAADAGVILGALAGRRAAAGRLEAALAERIAQGLPGLVAAMRARA